MRRYRVEYLPEAQDDLVRIREYLVELCGDLGATRIADRVVRRCEELGIFPNGYAVRMQSCGRAVRLTRSGRYNIAYMVDDMNGIVTILMVRYFRMKIEDVVERLA